MKNSDSTASDNIEKWRFLVNYGKTMAQEYVVVDNKRKNGNNDDSESSYTHTKNKKRNNLNKTHRLTNMVYYVLPEDIVYVKISSAE